MPDHEHIRISVEVNLFFQRIMKEHLFFLQTNLQPAAHKYIEKANTLKKRFEQLLNETLPCARGVVSESAIQSNEFVTPYTLKAEDVNSRLTGASIDTGITKREQTLTCSSPHYDNQCLSASVDNLNHNSLHLLQETISFQKYLLSQSSNCNIFISLYPQMLDHDTREAEHYLGILKGLLSDRPPKETLCDELNFWNTIMAEHAEFIDGMLDPTEADLKKTAEATAKKFEKLVNECIYTAEEQILQTSLYATEGIRSFKTKATEGLLACRIKSIIPPLLADHVLREANHYLRLMKMNECCGLR